MNTSLLYIKSPVRLARWIELLSRWRGDVLLHSEFSTQVVNGPISNAHRGTRKKRIACYYYSGEEVPKLSAQLSLTFSKEMDTNEAELELPDNDDSTNNNVYTPSSSFSSIASYPSTPSSLCSTPSRRIGGGEIEEIPSRRFLSSSFREVFRPRFRSRSRSSMAIRNDYYDEARPWVRTFSLRELQVATNNFNRKNLIGSGGFSRVYKGRLVDGSLVAVKRFRENRTPEIDLEFQTEADIGSMVVHPNILPLRGFCKTSKEKLLVYPYMANGIVDSWSRDPTMKEQLYWDLTARNIQLDSDMNPKILDFWNPVERVAISSAPRNQHITGHLILHGLIKMMRSRCPAGYASSDSG